MIMEKKATRGEKLVVGLYIGLLMCFSFTIMTRFFTRHILINYLGMRNAFVELVWFDNKAEGGLGDQDVVTVDIDWSALYPFDDSKSEINVVETESETSALQSPLEDNVLSKSVEKYTAIVTNVQDKIESFATDLLAFRSKIVEAAHAYEKYIGWNFSSFGEYNGVVQLSDGYLTGYVSKKDASQHYEALVELNSFCQNEGINFLYVQAPYKISEYDDMDVSGTVDFSNQNADELLEQLEDAEIDYYDIREAIHENDLYNHDLFYKTDHHWLTTTGLWAAQNILAYCNENYGWSADLSLLDADQFEYVTYENWFLGSQGKKVTLARCQPDDFTLLYPKYNTSFHYYVPAEGVDTLGDYSVVYNMSQVEECDYYNLSPYHACNYGDQPLIQIENLLSVDDHKILIISDSFSDCMISCLALAESNVDSLDLRHFTGSVKAYIEESQPDIVMVMYNASAAGGDVDYSSHTDLFDFR
jgi:hypothetical protein